MTSGYLRCVRMRALEETSNGSQPSTDKIREEEEKPGTFNSSAVIKPASQALGFSDMTEPSRLKRSMISGKTRITDTQHRCAHTNSLLNT